MAPKGLGSEGDTGRVPGPQWPLGVGAPSSPGVPQGRSWKELPGSSEGILLTLTSK